MIKAMPIEWHKQGLKNMASHLQEEQRRLACQIANVQRMADRVAFLEFQIEVAEEEGKESFDSERYKVPKAKRD